MADNLPPSSADVTEFESLNLPEPSGPHRPVMGLLYLIRIEKKRIISQNKTYIFFHRLWLPLHNTKDKREIDEFPFGWEKIQEKKEKTVYR
jgi:hypothetical protein